MTRNHYTNMEYNKGCLAILSFIADLSANYLHLSKDRLVLYSNSVSRKTGTGTRYDHLEVI